MTMIRPDLIDSKGQPIQLGAVLGKGGEGTVYEIARSPATAAKIYHASLGADRSAKIRAMLEIKSTHLSAIAAWPSDLLISRTTRQPVGLLMPRIVNKKNVHHVYGPKSRLKDFPRADWRFLVRTAANIARAFSLVHDAQCVIGDVNHGSIMVAEDATVTLIDCDSFQIRSSGKIFPCEVGIETFTPPELQEKSLRDTVRTPDHDNFGLAVIVFHLLFMGRHPFAGRFLGTGDMPIAKAIKEYRFPYGERHQAMQMLPPPGTAPLSILGRDVSQLFEAAFCRGATSSSRPTARKWISALSDLEKTAKQCALSKSHWYPIFASACPWCQMEGQGANPLFPFILPTGSYGGSINVEGLWRTLKELADPGTAPASTVPEPPPSSEAETAGAPNKAAKPTALAIAVGAFVIGMIVKPSFFLVFAIGAGVLGVLLERILSKHAVIETFRLRMAQAEKAYADINADWDRRASGLVFYEARSNFEELKRAFDAIPQKRAAALDVLRNQQRGLQLDRFLAGFEIEDAQIDSIGPGRKRLLASYGIEAADDVVVSRLNAVPGFGPKMVGKLLRWRRSVESKFVFDPSKGNDPRDVAKVEQDILAARQKIEISIRAAHTRTIQAHIELSRIRLSMREQVDQAAQLLGQARADYRFVSGK
ncbi:MAG: hypothetical protein JSR24_13045 [Proteobacteria bacterium]|nr:hypothetical protein [Pseudomonadota bacterium]